MQQFIENLINSPLYQQEEPLPEKDVITAQKELVRDGFPFLPLDFVAFLQKVNGVSGVDSAILGIPPTANEQLDILAFNMIFNQTADMVILGYDDFNFLVYNHSLNIYQLIDREDNIVVEEFKQNELKYALNSILHVNDD